jgi:hypothetical protein
MTALLHASNRLFDAVEALLDGPEARRSIGTFLTTSFFVALVVIEINRQGWLPPTVGNRLPVNHFYAVDVAFTLFLFFEVIDLVLGLATSVADALGKQFEIFSLIMLRQSFKELVDFQEPIRWTLANDATREAVQRVVVDATGALAVFLIVGVYYKLQRHRRITETAAEQQRFVSFKKLLSNVLLLVLAGLVLYTGGSFVAHGHGIAFFDTFYTVLIFSDVLIVLLSLRYSTTYYVVFRNSGFAAATVMIRLALAGPRYIDVLLGIGAALFGVGLTAAYNYVVPAIEQSKKRNREQKHSASPARSSSADGADTEDARSDGTTSETRNASTEDAEGETTEDTPPAPV